MHRVLLLGAGKIGSAISKFLASTGDFEVTVGDIDQGMLDRLPAGLKATKLRLDVSKHSELVAAMQGKHTVISACSYVVNPGIARACLEAGCSYFDLTEDVATTRTVRELSAKARPGQIFMPQCGLAPGFISVVAAHLTQPFDSLDEVRMRVGALPIYPTNNLKYNLTWSTDGLINEYCNPCEAIRDTTRTELMPLEGLEHFSLDGLDYEAFNTSGGLGTLCETLDGKLRTLDYKTVRYPGHRDLVKFLAEDLRLAHRRDLFKDILEHAVPMTLQDVVLVFVTVTGKVGGRLMQRTDSRKIYHADVLGEHWSAIQITTAAGMCTVVDLHREGKLPSQGFAKQEQVGLDAFLANRFGRYYDVIR